MCKGFGSTLTGPTLQWYINLPSRSIASFTTLSDKYVEQFASSRDLEKTSDGLYEILQHRAEPLQSYIARFNQKEVAVPECSIPTAISAFKRGLLPDGDLYKELTKYQCKTMEDVISRAWAQVKWEEDVANRAKAQLKQDSKTIKSDRTERDERSFQRPARDSGNRNRGRYQNRPIEKAEGMVVSTWLDVSHLSISKPELVSVYRQMGQQVKWPQKMKAPDSLRNPGLWCRSMTRSSCSLPPLGGLSGYMARKSGSKVVGTLDLELGSWDPEPGGGGAAVFPALGQGSFRGTTPVEFDKYSKALYPPSYQVYLGFHYHLVFPGNPLLAPPAFGIRQSCKPGRKMLCPA
ncbi:hypothetical protein F2Q69_00053297 [Brassica cretica]|uniref:Retrotransposon gag domain-containing protein n=1 Tax=Brassica cretica TaxID=69181 RepID=A0A8S9MY80_BRACR|nr:hypothetical protein F2Q69_00053297 [Brassica cretica]